MNKESALELVLEAFPNAYFISSNGYITRDFYNLKDREQHFYMLGSMGMAAPVALGLALVHPDQDFVILDGDGSFLMNLGIVAIIGNECPRNLIHVVLDNGMHESTGGQKTVPFPNAVGVARNAGYAHGFKVYEPDDWRIPYLRKGPVLIHMMIDPREGKIGNRVEWTPQQIVSRFTWALTKKGVPVQ